MPWTTWVLVVAVGLAAGIAGAFLYVRWRQVLHLAAWGRLWLGKGLLTLSRRRAPSTLARPVPAVSASEEAVVLIPDGRPWPLGPALQLLELAWRWQVVHGTHLPLRARQGEGAYVWRPPLPSRASENQPGVEAEH